MTFLTSAVTVRSLANIAEYPAGATFGPRRMVSYEFVWILRGSAIWHITGPKQETVESHQVPPGVIALSPFGGTERYDWDPDQLTSHGFVHFELPTSTDPSDWPRVRRLSECRPVGALAESLLFQTADDERSARERTAHTVGLMLETFLSPGAGSLDDSEPGTAGRAVRFVRETWSAEGMRILGIGEIARAVNVSAGHLSRSFGARFGIGPSAAFELVRLARAAVALQRTSLTLSKIAAEHGFTDEYHLSRRFSRVYGSPPGAYRRTRSGDEALAPLIERRLTPLWNLLVAT